MHTSALEVFFSHNALYKSTYYITFTLHNCHAQHNTEQRQLELQIINIAQIPSIGGQREFISTVPSAGQSSPSSTMTVKKSHQFVADICMLVSCTRYSKSHEDRCT